MVIKVLVKLKRKESLSWDGQQIIASINATPIKGAANKRLRTVLSEWLDIPCSDVTIQIGRKSRHKSINIRLNPEELTSAIAGLPKYPKQLKLL